MTYVLRANNTRNNERHFSRQQEYCTGTVRNDISLSYHTLKRYVLYDHFPFVFSVPMLASWEPKATRHFSLEESSGNIITYIISDLDKIF